MQLKLVFFFAFTIITALGAATVNQCIGYLQDVGKSVGTLTAGIENFDPTNLWDAWNIHINARKTQVVIDQTIICSQTMIGNVSETQSHNILNLIRETANVTMEGLKCLKGLKSEIDQIIIPGSKAIVKADLESLRLSSSLLEDALISRAPHEVHAEADQLKASVNQVFEETIKAFA